MDGPFLPTLNINLLYGPAIPLLGIYRREMITRAHEDMDVSVRRTLSTTAETWKLPKHARTGEWINKCSVPTQWGVTGTNHWHILQHRQTPKWVPSEISQTPNTVLQVT